MPQAGSLTAARFLTMGFQHIPLLDVIEALQHDSALGTGVHFIDFVPEVPEAGNRGFVNNFVLAKDSDLGASGHAALSDPATGDLDSPSGWEQLPDFSFT